MNRITFLLLLLNFTGNNCISQSPNAVGDLRDQVAAATTDTARVWALHNLAFHYLYANTDSSMWYAKKELALTKKIGYTRGEIRGLNDIANVLGLTGNFGDALQILFEALQKAEQTRDWRMQALCLGNLGGDYSVQGDYKQVIQYAHKALPVLIALKDTPRLTVNYSNLGECFMKMNQVDSALLYINQAYQLNLIVNDQSLMGNILADIGEIQAKLGNEEIATSYYRKSVAVLSRQGNFGILSDTYLSMAELWHHAGKMDSALVYLQKAYAAGQLGSYPTGMLKAASMLAALYDNRNKDSTLKYLRLSVALKDSLFSKEKTAQIQNLAFNERLRQQDLAFSKEKEKEQRRQNIQYAAIALCIIVFITLFLLLSRSVIVHEKWISFFGILGLLIIFEFINLVIHPYLAIAAHESPVLMLLALVAIASLLIPLHRQLEKWIRGKMVEKHKEMRLRVAKKTIQELETKANKDQEELSD